MSQIPCFQCTKIFRTPIGLAWHLDHIHRIEDKAGPDGSSGAASGRADADLPCVDAKNLPVEVVVGQDSHAVDGLPTMLEEVHLSLDHNNATVESLLSTVDNLEARIASLESLARDVTELRTEVASLNRCVSTVESMSVYLSRLLWQLDRGHRQKSIMDLLLRCETEEELEHVRDFIRSFLLDHDPRGELNLLTGS